MISPTISVLRRPATVCLANGNLYRNFIACRTTRISTLATILRSNHTTTAEQIAASTHRHGTYLGLGLVSVFCLYEIYKHSKTKPTASLSTGTYKAYYFNPMPPHIVEKMIGKSYKEGCPIPITDLAYVKVTHYNMKGEICTGELVVHKKIAGVVMEIFRDIFAAKFPIDKMRLIDEYGADDERSMQDNNSSAFCYRSITGRPGVVSNHGLGIAIDINTRLNPYVKERFVAPSNAQKYANRSLNEPGMIHPDSAVVKAFTDRGFDWGGNWKTLKDYQHFEIDRKKLGITV